MKAVDEDRLRLNQMLGYAREVVGVTSQAAPADLEKNPILLRALSRSTGMLGEVAVRISEPYRLAHAEIPWRQITRLRSFLLPEYYPVDPDALWYTATISVPALIPQLEALSADER